MKSKFITITILCFLIISFIGVVTAGTSGFNKANIISECPSDICPLFNKPDGVWVFNWIDNGFEAERIYATFDKNADLNVGDEEAKQDFSIEIESSDNYCSYDILREADRTDVNLFELKKIDVSYWYWEVDTQSEWNSERIKVFESLGCYNIEIGGQFSVRGFVEWDMFIAPINGAMKGYCWAKKDTIGQAGSFKNLKYGFDTSFNLKAEGKTPIIKTLSYSSTQNTDEISQQLSNNAYVIWNGNLVSGETCPVGTDEYLTYNPNTFKWIITDRTNYIQYEAKLSDLSLMAKQVYEGSQTVFNTENSINSFASRAIAPRNISYSPLISSYSSSSGRVIIDLGKKIIFPLFTFYVDSDYLQVEKLVGVPKLDKDSMGRCLPTSSLSYNMGDLYAGQFNAKVSNAGSSKGSFLTKVLSCTNTLLSATSSSINTFFEGDSYLVPLYIPAQLDSISDIKGTCTIQSKDISSGAKDTCTISVDVTKPASCVEGRRTCSVVGESHVIKECVSGSWTTNETCNSEEVCKYNDRGLPVCVLSNNGNGNGNCVDCDAYALSKLTFGYYKSCKPKLLHNTIFCMFSFIKLILVPIVFLIALLVSVSFFNSFKALRGKEIAGWLLGLLVAGLLAVAVYMLFFVGIIIAVIALAIFKFAKPKVRFRDMTYRAVRRIPRKFREYRR